MAYSIATVDGVRDSLNNALNSSDADGVSNRVVRLGDDIKKMNSLWTSTNGKVAVQGLIQSCNALQEQVDRLEKLINDLNGCRVDYVLESHSDIIGKEPSNPTILT